MLDFNRFSLSNMVECGSTLRSLGNGAGSMEEAARRIVTAINDWFRVPETGQPACVLVRLFKTHMYRHLPVELQVIAQGQMAPSSPEPDTRCLTLLGTTGLLDPAQHSRAIPAAGSLCEDRPVAICQRPGFRPQRRTARGGHVGRGRG